MRAVQTLDAVDKKNGRAVAIKRFVVRGARSWKDVELAEREAAVLSTLEHPSLPAYFEHFEENGELYLVMEKLEGESLAALRKRFAKGIRIACNGNASADRLAEILQPFRPGATPVTVRYVNARIGGDLELPEAWRVNPDDALIDRLREWLAPENVQVVY